MSNELIFLLAVIALILIFAYTAYGRRGQSDISQHPVDTRSDVPPGAGAPTGINERPDPAEANHPNQQRGVK
jgi:hypothetical protein